MSEPFGVAIADLKLTISAPAAWRTALVERYRPFVVAADGGWQITLTHDATLGDDDRAWIRHSDALTEFRVLAYQGWIDLTQRAATVSSPGAERAASALERTLAYVCMQALPRTHDALLLHACGVVLDGLGHIFVGPSGAGKTTLARLAGDHAELLCDENVVVQIADDGAWLHSTPFWGHSTPPALIRRVRRQVPLAAVHILAQTPDFALTPLPPAAAVLALLASEKVPAERPASADAWLAVAEQLVAAVPVTRLGFRPTAAVWPFLRAARIAPA